VFAGPNAQLRKHKKVREVIEVHQHNFKPLIKDLGFEKVFDTVIFLLNGRIFQSELKAKITFPELFRTTPIRDVQHAESEKDAVRSEAEALEDLLSTDEAEVKNDNCRNRDKDENKDEDRAESKSTSQLGLLLCCINMFYKQLNKHYLKLYLYTLCTYPTRPKILS